LLSKGFTGIFLGNMHPIVTFLAVTFLPYDSDELCTGFVVALVESENLIVFCTAVHGKN